MAQETGGGAFPVTGLSNRNGQMVDMVYHPGMSLRDYFAAKAMHALILNTTPDLLNGLGWEHIIPGAYHAADLMLAERSK